MVTCKECNKRFRIKLGTKFFGVILKDGYQTKCPYCGHITYLGTISPVRSIMFWSHVLTFMLSSYLGANIRTLHAQGRLIIVVAGFVILVFAISRISLWIAGRVYDKLSK